MKTKSVDYPIYENELRLISNRKKKPSVKVKKKRLVMQTVSEEVIEEKNMVHVVKFFTRAKFGKKTKYLRNYNFFCINNKSTSLIISYHISNKESNNSNILKKSQSRSQNFWR